MKLHYQRTNTLFSAGEKQIWQQPQKLKFFYTQPSTPLFYIYFMIAKFQVMYNIVGEVTTNAKIFVVAGSFLLG